MCFFFLLTSNDWPLSSDHLIRPPQDILWNRETDLLGGLEIEHQLELRRLLHRQIGGLGSLQDLFPLVENRLSLRADQSFG